MLKNIFAFLFLLCLAQSANAADVVVIAGQSGMLTFNQQAFINKYFALSGKTVVIQQCAIGGTYLYQHAQEATQASFLTPSTNCRITLQARKAAGDNIIGVIFWQGESDTIVYTSRTGFATNVWAQDWLHWMRKTEAVYREALNQPDLPFVVLNLPTWTSPACVAPGVDISYYNLVKIAQNAANQLWRTSKVNLDDIKYTCGDIHVTGQPAALVTISERAAQSFYDNF